MVDPIKCRGHFGLQDTAENQLLSDLPHQGLAYVCYQLDTLAWSTA